MGNCCDYFEQSEKSDLISYQKLRDFFYSKQNEISKKTFDLCYSEYKSKQNKIDLNCLNLKINEINKGNTKKFLYLSRLESIVSKIIYLLEIQFFTFIKKEFKSYENERLIFDTGILFFNKIKKCFVALIKIKLFIKYLFTLKIKIINQNYICFMFVFFIF